MKDKKNALEIISEKLRGIPWAIYSGTAVEIFTEGKRRGRDIDIIVPEDKIDEVAKRFNAKPILETREKEGIKIVNDYHIETEVAGIPVEFIGKTEKFIIDGEEYNPASSENSQKLFKKVERINYLGIEVPVVPVEEVLAQKIIWNRSGEWQDEEDIKLLKDQKISYNFLADAFDRWGVPEDKQKVFISRVKRLLSI